MEFGFYCVTAVLAAARFVRQGVVVAEETSRFVVGRRVGDVESAVRRRIADDDVQLPQPTVAARRRHTRAALFRLLVSLYSRSRPIMIPR